MLVFESYASAYSGLRDLLINSPVVSSRIGETKEIIGCSFEVTNPRSRLGYHKERKYNLPFAVAETVCDVVGINSVEFLSYFNRKVSDYSDDGHYYYGAYGPRISKNITKIIDELKQNPNSRRAVITIYNTNDLYVSTKDIPCTVSMQFLVRNDKLFMLVNMRSNDFIWGLQYDLFRFTMLQELIANELGVGLGSYLHVSGSMHIYEWHYELIDVIKTVEEVEMPVYNLGIQDYMHAVFSAEDNILTDLLYRRVNDLPDWAKKFISK